MRFKIIVETEGNDISLEDMENIMDEALNYGVISCTFDVEVENEEE